MAPVTRVLRGRIYIGDEGKRRTEAIAWRDGSIVACGSERDVLAAAGAGAVVEDTGGSTVLPGFIDAHQHPSIIALYAAGVRLTPPEVTDIASLQRRIAAAASITAEGEWIVATHWDENLLAERRPPTRAELDDAAPDHPVFALHYTCHRGVANGRALDRVSIDRGSPDPAGGFIGRDSRGSPNGLLVERAMSPVESLARAALVARDAEGFFSRLLDHHRALAASGITRVVDAATPMDLVALYRAAADRGALIVPTLAMPVSTSGWLEAPWDAIEGPATGTTEGALEIGPVKLIFDGAPGCAMCLSWWQSAASLLHAFAISVAQRTLGPIRASMSLEPRMGAKIRTGITIYAREEAKRVIDAAIERGFAVATHAIGNEAIEHALEVYESVDRLDSAGMPRLEHAAFLSPELVRRIAGVGAAVVTQPHFASLPAYEGAPSIPGIRNAPLRWLLDAGVKVAGSSDFPVAGFAPLDAIRSAVTRRTNRGRIYEGDQRISLDEAIAIYTRHAAEVTGCLSSRGTLEVGKRADLVVVDGPLETDRDLEHARVRATFIGGELVFGRAQTESAP
jgi:predicted amidohydrolase YtcJ